MLMCYKCNLSAFLCEFDIKTVLLLFLLDFLWLFRSYYVFWNMINYWEYALKLVLKHFKPNIFSQSIECKITNTNASTWSVWRVCFVKYCIISCYFCKIFDLFDNIIQNDKYLFKFIKITKKFKKLTSFSWILF